MPSNILRSISNISVKSLFGMYDYDLIINPNEHAENEKIVILYGDNGSGKSTLLRLAFHMLAPNQREGHKTFLLNTEFQELSVKFNDGTLVKAKRGRDYNESSAYKLSVKRPRKNIVSADVIPDSDPEKDSDLHTIVEPALEDLDCALYLLSDDRAIHRAGGAYEKSSSKSKRYRHHLDEMSSKELEFHRLRSGYPETPEDLVKELLKSAIEETEIWFRRRVIGSSTRGDSGVNELYSKILKKISETGGGKSTSLSKKKLKSRVHQLVINSKNLDKYGLLPEFDGKDIIKIIDSADTATFNVIVDVLTPYLDSMETKNEAMEDIYERINTFVTVADKFYTNKDLSFHLRKGIRITSSSGQLLEPEMLSSGERHLLLLFCTSIVTGEKPSILMIDEPEISLNIKWQRMLVDALIQCIGDNDVQFVFSTHSLEILAKHKARVVKLVSQ